MEGLSLLFTANDMHKVTPHANLELWYVCPSHQTQKTHIQRNMILMLVANIIVGLSIVQRKKFKILLKQVQLIEFEKLADSRQK